MTAENTRRLPCKSNSNFIQLIRQLGTDEYARPTLHEMVRLQLEQLTVTVRLGIRV